MILYAILLQACLQFVSVYANTYNISFLLCQIISIVIAVAVPEVVEHEF